MSIRNEITKTLTSLASSMLKETISDMELVKMLINDKFGIYKVIDIHGEQNEMFIESILEMLPSKKNRVYMQEAVVDLGCYQEKYIDIDRFSIIDKRNLIVIKNEYNRKNLIKKQGFNINRNSLVLCIIGKDSYRIYKDIIKTYNSKLSLYKKEAATKMLVHYNIYGEGELDRGVYIPMKKTDEIFMNNKKILLDKIDRRYKNLANIAKFNINTSINILLYGPTGTGKSTMALNISSIISKKISAFSDKDSKEISQIPPTPPGQIRTSARAARNNSRKNNINTDIVYFDIVKNDITTLYKNAADSYNSIIIILEEIDTCINRDDIYGIDRNYNNDNFFDNNDKSPVDKVDDIPTDEEIRKNSRPVTVMSRTNLGDLLRFLDNPPPSIKMIIATTNYLDSLDPALKRDGRFDIKFECGNINKDIASDMVRYFEKDPDQILKDCVFPICPTTVQKLCIDDMK